MPSRRKLINQVVTRVTGFAERVPGGTTTAQVGAIIDREQIPMSAQGALSLLLTGASFSLSVADTSPFTIVLYHSDLTDVATFSAFNTSLYSFTIAGSISTGATCNGNVWDIAGARRYLEIALTVTGATTVTSVVTVTATFGDAQVEP